MTIKKRGISFVLLEILIILVYLNPVADLFPSYIQIVVFVLWILANIKNKEFLGKAIPLTMGNIIIFVFSLLRCVYAEQLNTDYYSTFQVVIARYQMMIYPILFVYVIGLKKDEKKHLFNLALFCIVGTILVSLYYIVFVDPQAIRNTQREIALFGVGDFMLMYAMAIAVGPLLFLILERKKKEKRIFSHLISFILIIVCLVLCNLVTSVVIATVSIFIMYIISRKNKKMLVFTGFGLALAFALKEQIAKIFYFIASKNFFYWSTNNKIIAIANVLNGNMTDIDTLSRRFMLARWSLESFKKHPILGINWKDHQYGAIGCHMQWADDLGRYGIVGNMLSVFNYLYIANYTLGNTKERFVKNSIITVWIMFLILGFLNPCLSATNLMMMFVVIPSMDGFIEEKRSY